MKSILKATFPALLLALVTVWPTTRLHAADPVDQVAQRVVEQALEKVEAALDQVESQVEADDESEFDWGEPPKSSGKEIILTGQSVTVKPGEVISQVVVTQGSATIDGDVTGDVVVILGKARINGRVWGNVVNVGQGLLLGPGARIRGDAVGVLGGIRMDTNSVIGGTAVGVVGGITKLAGAQVLGEEVPIAFGNWTGPDGLNVPAWVSNSFYQLVLKARPLALDVGWVWVVWAIFLGVYLLLGLLFPAACELTATVLKTRALTSVLVGLLLIPLIPLVLLILSATGVGLVAVPFLVAALFVAGLVGKAALFLHLGNAVGRQFKTQFPPLLAILVGAVPMTLLYLVPLLGLVMLKLTDLWALGAATLALFAGFQKERPTQVPPSSPAPAAPTTATSPLSSNPTPTLVRAMVVPPAGVPAEPAPLMSGSEAPPVTPLAGVAAAADTIPGEAARPVEPPFSAPAAPQWPDALTLPRVGFKDRFLATCIDWLILLMVCGPLGLMRFFMLLFPVYFAAMWVWKQTTLGGTVLRLKVVRLDGRPMDWPTAAVRAVGALFGTLAAGLGYFWSGWDAEKQGWHDKIAGTVVVKVPQVTPLV
jgi:uncharacterized RDD family membrane protein YckC